MYLHASSQLAVHVKWKNFYTHTKKTIFTDKKYYIRKSGTIFSTHSRGRGIPVPKPEKIYKTLRW